MRLTFAMGVAALCYCVTNANGQEDNAADLAKTLAPWTPFLKFTTRAILPIRESAEINGAAAAWRDAQ